ncbi:MAG: BBP7 family outer membrane beta-barrel protein [Planctomycetaceae bacterium]|nr:BBP7 family outer membrane beta-barrel protein [Planctomycetaceae bacterium]
MFRWCSLTSLLLVILGLPNASRAQAPPTGEGVTPAGWQSAGPGQAHIKQKRSFGEVGPIPAGPGRTIYRELPDDTGWLYEDSPLERSLKNAFRHSYFRMEYLLWDVGDPGNNLLGAPTAILDARQLAPNDPSDPDYPSTIDPTLTLQQQYVYQPFVNPTTPFQVSNPIVNNTSLIAVVQPSTSDVLINENNGIRATFGMPVWNAGAFEASIFALQPSTSNLGRQPIPRFDNSYDSDGDFVFINPGVVVTGSAASVPALNGLANETFIGTGIGEFDRNGNGLTDDVVNDFEAFATPILINGGVPLPSRTPPLDPTDPTQRIDPATGQVVTGPFLWPSIRFPIAPLGPTIGPNGTPIAGIPIQDPRGRGDNFRIVWAIRNDGSDPGLPVNQFPFLNTYQAALKTSVWGTEANWISHGYDDGSSFSFKPLVGFRYAYFAESLRQSGAYTFVTVNPVNNQPIFNTIPRKIDSSTVNNLYGPQLGVRAEMANKWFTLGVQPKVMMGLNSYKANLETANILRPSQEFLGQADPTTAAEFLALGDVDQSLTENTSTFGVVGDLEVYSRVRLNNHLSAFVGYNFMWAGMITRPADNIVYNANIVPIDPTLDPNDNNTAARLDSDFQLKVDYSGAIIQGLTLGAELRY